MSLLDAAWAIRQAMRVSDEAEDMLTAGAIGDILRETIEYGMELLDVADHEMEGADLSRYRVLAAAPPLLRAKLCVVRDNLGGRSAEADRSATLSLIRSHGPKVSGPTVA